jgi:DNA-binding NarL/FixJ family response regulator
MERARIVLADDHPGLLKCIQGMLADEFDIIGMASDGKAVLETAKELNPDVLVLDITMPLMDGLEAARQLKEAGSTAKIVFLTIHQDPDFLKSAIDVGANGYVVKCRLASDLIPAVKEVLAGRQFVSPLG